MLHQKRCVISNGIHSFQSLFMEFVRLVRGGRETVMVWHLSLRWIGTALESWCLGIDSTGMFGWRKTGTETPGIWSAIVSRRPTIESGCFENRFQEGGFSDSGGAHRNSDSCDRRANSQTQTPT